MDRPSIDNLLIVPTTNTHMDTADFELVVHHNPLSGQSQPSHSHSPSTASIPLDVHPDDNDDEDEVEVETQLEIEQLSHASYHADPHGDTRNGTPLDVPMSCDLTDSQTIRKTYTTTSPPQRHLGHRTRTR
jgi:hypothetical protein